MKTYKNLYNKMTTFENLELAYRKAKRNKKKSDEMLQFMYQWEKHLWDIKEELETGIYQPGDYSSFRISYPKARVITKAPFKDRVVHHALCNIIEPIFEKTFIYDSYANRLGKGTHKALLNARVFYYQNEYILKCDVRKYFPSIDHNILKKLIRRKIGDKRLLSQIDSIIDKESDCEKYDALQYIDTSKSNSVIDQWQDLPLFNLNGQENENVDRQYGLPLGNLTSQFFANIYLNQLDHYVKEQLKARYYIRYVDDCLLFSNSKEELRYFRDKIREYLSNDLLLQLHPSKQEIFPRRCGLDRSSEPPTARGNDIPPTMWTGFRWI